MAHRFRQKENNLILFSILFSLCIFFLPADVFASEGTFSVEPLFTDIRLDAEEEQSFSLEVGNTTSDPVVFRISFVDFGSLGESGGIAFLGEGSNLQKRYGLASWLSAEKDVVTVFPQSKETVYLTVRNRESLSPGGHYGAVMFRAEKEGNDDKDNASVVSVSPNFTALVFVRKTGGEREELNFKDTVVRADMLGVPEKASERFQNSGNVHVTPRGIVEVRDMFGRLVRRGILNEESGIILPESYRLYPVALQPLDKAVFPGFYMVTATYRFDGQDAFESIPMLRVFSWQLILPWISIFLGIYFVLRRLLRKKKR